MASEHFGGILCKWLEPQNQDATSEGQGLEPELSVSGRAGVGCDGGNHLSPGHPHPPLWITPQSRHMNAPTEGRLSQHL